MNSDYRGVKKTLVYLWLLLRSYTFLCSLGAAALAGKPLLYIWTRWDAIYYVRIAEKGYSPVDGTTNFHPLYPYFARPLAVIGFQPIVSLLIISSLATLALTLLFFRLASVDQSESQAWRSTLLFSLWPISYLLYIPYSESLWLTFAVLCLFLARRNRWWLAGITAALATLTRQQGLFLVVPLAWELWSGSNYKIRVLVSSWRKWLWLGMIPLAYVSWIVYRTALLGDEGPNSDSILKLITSTLISPASHQVVKDNRFTWPWEAAYLAVKRALELSFVNPWSDLIFGVAFLILIGLAWSKLRTSYKLYVIVITLVSLSFHTGMTATGGAYMSLPRHLLLAFPVFIGLGERLGPRTAWTLAAVGFLIFPFLLCGYLWARLVP